MKEASGFFITGTDTDIGKTWVSRILYATFNDLTPARYMKPVQTGCARRSDGTLSAPDYETVLGSLTNGLIEGETGFDLVPYAFETPCSPHRAAARAEVTISLDVIANAFQRCSKDGLVIVEGAGGVLVPLAAHLTMLDCIISLDIPVILVTTPRLGTLNHTFLSLEALTRRGIVPAAIMYNSPKPVTDMDLYVDNRDTIRSYIPTVPLIEVPYGTDGGTALKDFCHGCC